MGAPPLSHFLRQGGAFDFGGDLVKSLSQEIQISQVKIPTLSLQKTEGQGWGTHYVLTVLNVISFAGLPVSCFQSVNRVA
jgi:hypothetical protein